MQNSFFKINRLRILKSGKAVYDQEFHSGVNIIRGDNSSGKSTISDFIFYILGGEYDNWKAAAKLCEEVQAEIFTKNGTVTLKREINTRLTPIYVYYGSMDEAEKSALDGWERHPIRRVDSTKSISQILFSSIGLPEAKSEGSSNITMHQIMRLLYSDQRTPHSRLFRFESFDTKDIREAVGDLVCGLNVYELYDIQLKLRDLDKDFNRKSKEWDKLLSSFPHDEALGTVASINSRLSTLEDERKALVVEIDNVDNAIDDIEVKEFLKKRQSFKSSILKLKEKSSKVEFKIEKLKFELEDLYEYSKYLNKLLNKLSETSSAAKIIGDIEFSHCPACLKLLSLHDAKTKCTVCGQETDYEHEKSKYLKIHQDLEIQNRETSQLIEQKELLELHSKKELRALKREYEQSLVEYTVSFDISISPRENYLAERNNRLGQIEKEIKFIANLYETARELERVSTEKSIIQADINKFKDRQKALEVIGRKRRSVALTQVSDIAKEILLLDFDRQVEFKRAKSISLNFTDDVTTVDGEMNFSDSSSVILKNTALFSLFLSSIKDSKFYHPRFLLLDNIEDKGMQEDRSHNYQKIIVNALKNTDENHQLIFTTSMITPELDLEEYTVGPYYTNENKTLNFDTEQ